MSNIFTGERPHYEDEGGTNSARYYFARKYCKGKKVVDIGCGQGYGSSILSPLAKSILGLDYNQDAINYASKNYKHKNLRFSVGDFVQFKGKEKFDVVVAFEVIEHIYEDENFLKNICTILNGNSLVLISTPNKLIHSPHTDTPPNPYHVREYTPPQLKELLKKFFNEVDLYGMVVKNKEKAKIEEGIHSSLKWKIISWVFQFRTVRKWINIIPKNLRQKTTGLDKLQFTGDDFTFSRKDILSSPYLMAICKKK